MHYSKIIECDFPAWTKGTKCTRCEFVLPIDFISLPTKVCGNQSMGLGTKLAFLFKYFGIKNQCIPCQKREKLLNRIGARLYYIYIGWWNGSLFKPSKAKRRKQLLAQQNSTPLPLQEERAAAKELRRQQLLQHQNLTSPTK